MAREDDKEPKSLRILDFHIKENPAPIYLKNIKIYYIIYV